MLKMYEKWIVDWETRLTSVDTNRVVRPMEWGLDWCRAWPCVNGNFPPSEAHAEEFLHTLNDEIVRESDQFFAYQTPTDYRTETRLALLYSTRSSRDEEFRHKAQMGEFLRFTSPVNTPHAENNLVNARWFPGKGKRAVVIIPHWNSDAESHNALGRWFAKLGIATLRLSMPYHDIRRPAELQRADYAVSANIGRTIDATRQGIIDIRCCLDWLEQQGYTELGLVGTSLGSCYSFIAAAHDPRVKACVFNHASTYFADVVWTGQSTRHIREGLEAQLDVERLRQAWLCISPMAYFDKFARTPKRCKVIYATYDLTFLPEFSRQVVDEFHRHQTNPDVVELPCGHYTLGETPFKFLDGWHIINYLRKNL